MSEKTPETFHVEWGPLLREKDAEIAALKATNSLVLTNGQVRIEGAKAGDAGFYIVTEAP